MFYAMLADLVVLVHILFVLFVVFGGLAALRRRWLLWYHLPAAVWGVEIELGGWVCPLTHLENHFRRLGGEGGYSGTFFSHHSKLLSTMEVFCNLWHGFNVYTYKERRCKISYKERILTL